MRRDCHVGRKGCHPAWRQRRRSAQLAVGVGQQFPCRKRETVCRGRTWSGVCPVTPRLGALTALVHNFKLLKYFTKLKLDSKCPVPRLNDLFCFCLHNYQTETGEILLSLRTSCFHARCLTPRRIFVGRLSSRLSTPSTRTIPSSFGAQRPHLSQNRAA